ncbi:MAG: hypothetical protein CM1200mP41_21280 [Gammaproteobacteria bacterium]|nr:MAG: hypothetical protein CM1200mP41_21280 [Gammaproteobacteria bacterium]
MKDIRIGIDVGGTFTDFVLVSGESNLRITHKEASTPQDPSLAVESGFVSCSLTRRFRLQVFLSSFRDDTGVECDSPKEGK